MENTSVSEINEKCKQINVNLSEQSYENDILSFVCSKEIFPNSTAVFLSHRFFFLFVRTLFTRLKMCLAKNSNNTVNPS